MEEPKDGALLALAAYGQQDKWMHEDSRLFDMRKVFLTERYQVVYRKINTELKSVNNKKRCLLVLRKCDLINSLDIMIRKPENISSIEVEYGGQRFDKIYGFEQLKTLAALYRRPITNNGDTYMIPLCMAPFHFNNLAFPSTQWHELVISVEFIEPYDDIFEIYGKMYFLIPEARKRLFDTAHEYSTVQSQYSGEDRVHAGINTIALNFNHPVYMIYFYGLDKSKINNIRLVLNDAVYYDGPLLPLEQVKAARGLGHVEPVMMFFSPDPINVCPKSTINFSRLDYPKLEIDTTEEDVDVHVVGLNCQGVRYMNGMYGLVYSK